MNTQEKEVSIGILLMSMFTFVAIIYFANTVYSYYKNIEGQLIINMVLGIMFFAIGLFFLAIKTK